MEDNWKHRSTEMRCKTCMMFVRKVGDEPVDPDKGVIGRCRRKAPTMRGWPVVFSDDWCGEHKIDENKI